MIFSDEEKAFIVRVIEAAFESGLIKGNLKTIHNTSVIALDIIFKLAPQPNANGHLEHAQPPQRDDERERGESVVE